jgi:DNA-binding NarL/FixJ family response regulator
LVAACAYATFPLGSAGLQPAGVHPCDGEAEATSLDELRATSQVRPIVRDGELIGAVSVRRPDPLSRAEQQVLDDLTAQAALLIEHLDLSGAVARRRATEGLERLSQREREVLELMARGMSNAAICEHLHLSVKTVEPVVSTIFTKLGLSPDTGNNRRVLAVVAFLQAR